MAAIERCYEGTIYKMDEAHDIYINGGRRARKIESMRLVERMKRKRFETKRARRKREQAKGTRMETKLMDFIVAFFATSFISCVLCQGCHTESTNFTFYEANVCICVCVSFSDFFFVCVCRFLNEISPQRILWALKALFLSPLSIYIFVFFSLLFGILFFSATNIMIIIHIGHFGNLTHSQQEKNISQLLICRLKNVCVCIFSFLT